MKQIRYIFYLILTLALVSSCARENLEVNNTTDPQNSGKVTINWSAVIPNADIATKSMSETPAITSLYLVIFDENGMLSEVDKAIPGTYENPQSSFMPDGNSDYETIFHVEVTPSTNPRIIHFVANYDASKVDYGAEYDVMSKMATKGDADAYWQRVVVSDLNKNTIFTRVPLIRNFVKVTMSVKTGVDFTIDGYYVYNRPNSGSVAPFNVNTAIGSNDRFVQYVNSSNSAYTYSEIYSQGYCGFEPAGMTFDNATAATMTFTDPSQPTYMYERTYDAKSTHYPFFIIKGHRTGEASTYYKAAFCYNDTTYDASHVASVKVVYYNLIRDFNYQLKVTKISSNGYSTIDDAIAGLPMNDFFTTNTSSDINNIAADNQRLFVNLTDELCVSTDKIYLRYKNVSNVTLGTVDNSFNINSGSNAVTITGLTGDVVDTYSVATENDADGSYYRTVTITPKAPTVGETKRQVITLKNAAGLARTITLTLREPLTLTLACTPATVTALTQDIDMTMTIPSGLSSNRFPLEFKIESDKKNVYPDAADASYAQMPVVIGKSIIDKTSNSYCFKRSITWAEYSAAVNNNGYKTFDCHFLLYNSKNGVTTLYVVPNSYFDLTKTYTTTFTVNI